VCFGGSRSGVSSMESRGIPPEMSNFYCLPGRAGGTPNVLEARHRGELGRETTKVEMVMVFAFIRRFPCEH
jgi:hypothetical protein